MAASWTIITYFINHFMIQYFQQLPDIIYGISRQLKMSKLKNENKLIYLCLSLHLEIYIGLKINISWWTGTCTWKSKKKTKCSTHNVSIQWALKKIFCMLSNLIKSMNFQGAPPPHPLPWGLPLNNWGPYKQPLDPSS